MRSLSRPCYLPNENHRPPEGERNQEAIEQRRASNSRERGRQSLVKLLYIWREKGCVPCVRRFVRLSKNYATNSKRYTARVSCGWYSTARGDAERGSDIDVLVVLQGPVSPGEEIARTSEIISSLSLTHGVVLSRAFVSSDRFEREQSPLLMNIRREGVTV